MLVLKGKATASRAKSGTSQLFTWRRLAREGRLSGEAVIPAPDIRRHALRIVLIKPSLSSLFAGERLEMVDITRKGIGIDVDPDGIHRITLK